MLIWSVEVKFIPAVLSTANGFTRRVRFGVSGNLDENNPQHLAASAVMALAPIAGVSELQSDAAFNFVGKADICRLVDLTVGFGFRVIDNHGAWLFDIKRE